MLSVRSRCALDRDLPLIRFQPVISLPTCIATVITSSQRLSLSLSQQRVQLHPVFKLDPSRRINVYILQRLSSLPSACGLLHHESAYRVVVRIAGCLKSGDDLSLVQGILVVYVDLSASQSTLFLSRQALVPSQPWFPQSFHNQILHIFRLSK